MLDALVRRQDEGTLRTLCTPGDDGCLIDFTSNDYLGLGRSAELRESILREEARVMAVRSCG